MAKNTSKRTPKYRRQKRPQSVDQAFVELDGQRLYLGVYGTPESKEAYHRLLAEWNANGGRLPVPTEEVTVLELCDQFWKYAQGHYFRHDGTPSMLHRVKMAIKPLKKLYGSLPAAKFGPRALRTVRQSWIDAGLLNGG